MFLTASSTNQIFELCQKDSFFEDILQKYFSRKDERNEFRQHLWLTLLEKPAELLVEIWNRKEFKYFYLGIISKQVKSNSSPWHCQFRKTKEALLDHLPENAEEEQLDFILEEEEKQKAKIRHFKLKRVNEALSHYEKIDPPFKFEATLFRMYYFENLSIRQIQKRLHNISTLPIHKGIHYATTLVKFYLEKHKRGKSEDIY